MDNTQLDSLGRKKKPVRYDTRILLPLSSDMLARIKAVAKSHDMTVSQFIRIAIEEFVKALSD
jgi:predicted DNA binding CopG/RHH family protein